MISLRRVAPGAICFFLLAMAVMAASDVISTAAANSTVVQIALVFPYDVRATLGQVYNVGLNPIAFMIYNVVLRYVNKVNSNGAMLPGVTLKLLPLNSQYDRGGSLIQTLNASTLGASFVIGEVTSRSSVVVGLAAATSKMLHCNPIAATPQLSVKSDYPYSFRTTASVETIGKVMAQLAADNGVYLVSIIAANDEFGQGAVQSLNKYCVMQNITIEQIITFAPAAGNYTNEFSQLLNGKARTVFHIATSVDGATGIVNAQDLGLTDGRFWFLGYGYFPFDFNSAAASKAIKTLNGMTLLQAFAVSTRDSPIYAEEVAWYQSMFYPNSYNTPIMDTSGKPQCDLSIPGALACFNNTPFVAGYAQPLFAALHTPVPVLDIWNIQQQVVTCIDVIAGMLSYYLNNGLITPDDILQKNILQKVAGGKIQTLMNTPQVTDLLNNVYEFDANGDIITDIELMNWQWVDGPYTTYPVRAAVYHAKNNTISYVSPVIYFGNATTVPQPPPTPIIQYEANTSMRIAFDAIVGVCSFFTISLAVYMAANSQVKIVRASSPVFLYFIILGANISFISIWIFSQYPMNNDSCLIFVWLKYLGFAVVFGALIVKTYRISAIFVAKKSRSSMLSDGVMFIYFLIIVVVWVALLVIGTAIPDQRAVLAIESAAQLDIRGIVSSIASTPHCDFKTYNYVLLAAMVLTLLVGIRFTYVVRNTPSAFNETQWIAYAIYNWVVIGIVLNAITNFAVHNPDVVFVMEALIVIITQTGVCGLLFVPKVIAIVTGHGDENSTFQSSGGSHDVNSQTKSGLKTPAGPAGEDVEKLKARCAELEKQVESMKKGHNT